MLGKIVGGVVYLHRTLACDLGGIRKDRVREAERLLEAREIGIAWNVAKLPLDDWAVLSLLAYDDFNRVAFPSLRNSVRVDLLKRTVRERTERAENPPILHRKELLLSPDHPLRPTFINLTDELERRGLYREMSQMGRRKAWQERLAAAGIRIDDETHRVVEL